MNEPFKKQYHGRTGKYGLNIVESLLILACNHYIIVSHWSATTTIILWLFLCKKVVTFTNSLSLLSFFEFILVM